MVAVALGPHARIEDAECVTGCHEDVASVPRRAEAVIPVQFRPADRLQGGRVQHPDAARMREYEPRFGRPHLPGARVLMGRLPVRRRTGRGSGSPARLLAAASEQDGDAERPGEEAKSDGSRERVDE
ncbi:hypothetical protein [Arthrobacter sp. KBS0703]|uniref:hypothetical protein n=1 Tax=Arthrobacter sp. KBS0703 TaxID=1955698 RepID=UPI0021B101F8|nr:hypothetical protein [Arthrobacter sp. KBS0703]